MTVIEITFSAHKYLSFQKNQKVQVIIPQSMIDSSIKEVIYIIKMKQLFSLPHYTHEFSRDFLLTVPGLLMFLSAESRSQTLSRNPAQP